MQRAVFEKSIVMAEKKRILFVNQELDPYLPATPNGVLARELMCAMHGKVCEARTFMPRYGTINERRNKLHEVIRLSGANISIADSDHPLILKVASLPPSRIQVYFIDNDDFFEKEDTDIDPVGSNRPDNAWRMMFYARGATDTVNKLQWEPHIIQAQGWMSALFIPYMRKLAEEAPSFRNTRLIYAVTDDELQAPLNAAILERLKADGIDTASVTGLTPDTEMIHRLAIANADAVVLMNHRPMPELEKWIESLGKPTVRIPAEADNSTAISILREFYNYLDA